MNLKVFVALCLLMPSSQILSWKKEVFVATGITAAICSISYYLWNRSGMIDVTDSFDMDDLGMTEEEIRELENTLRALIFEIRKESQEEKEIGKDEKEISQTQAYTLLNGLIKQEERHPQKKKTQKRKQILQLLKTLPPIINNSVKAGGIIMRITKLCGIDL